MDYSGASFGQKKISRGGQTSPTAQQKKEAEDKMAKERMELMEDEQRRKEMRNGGIAGTTGYLSDKVLKQKK